MNYWFIGRVSLWLLLIFSGLLLFRVFRIKALILFLIVVLSNPLANFFPDLKIIYQISLALMFLLTGFVCFGHKPHQLRSILVAYLFINIPILLMQITGASWLVMTWGTDYLHTPSMLTAEQVGTFAKIPVYPTFLIPRDELIFMIGQARPSGLMAANNILSVIVCFSLLLNLHLRKKAVLNAGDVVVNFVAVLVMSKLVLVSALIFYTFGSFSERKAIRRAGIKNLVLLSFFFGMYYLAFPGLFAAIFSIESFASSFGLRMIDIFNSFNVPQWSSYYFFSSPEYGLINSSFGAGEELDHVSGIARIVASPLLVPILILIPFFLQKFRRGLSRCAASDYLSANFYKMFLFLIVLMYSVIAMMFQSILICFIIGIMLRPFFGGSRIKASAGSA